VREYDAFELGPLSFIVIPVLLVCVMAWGTTVAWRRAGAPMSAARRAKAISLVGASAWMAVTWMAAASGVLRQWDRTPPPFGLFVVSIIALAGALLLIFRALAYQRRADSRHPARA
jgi:hypothetical protein